jgi:hypothetical protein
VERQATKTIDRVVIYSLLSVICWCLHDLLARTPAIFVLNPKPVITESRVFLPMFYRK